MGDILSAATAALHSEKPDLGVVSALIAEIDARMKWLECQTDDESVKVSSELAYLRVRLLGLKAQIAIRTAVMSGEVRFGPQLPADE